MDNDYTRFINRSSFRKARFEGNSGDLSSRAANCPTLTWRPSPQWPGRAAALPKVYKTSFVKVFETRVHSKFSLSMSAGLRPVLESVPGGSPVVRFR